MSVLSSSSFGVRVQRAFESDVVVLNTIACSSCATFLDLLKTRGIDYEVGEWFTDDGARGCLGEAAGIAGPW
jgi:hypothetical protein